MGHVRIEHRRTNLLFELLLWSFCYVTCVFYTVYQVRARIFLSYIPVKILILAYILSFIAACDCNDYVDS